VEINPFILRKFAENKTYFAENRLAIAMYIHQLRQWPRFTWQDEHLATLLSDIRYVQGRLAGRMDMLGFSAQQETSFLTLTQDVLKTSEIEGETLPLNEVRSSIARRLNIDIGGLIPTDRAVDGVVDMLLDATQAYDKPLSEDRLLGWQTALFPAGRSGSYTIQTGRWRSDDTGPMQVVSGPLGRERVHFEAPASERLGNEMTHFINWFNTEQSLDPILKSAIAHLWFVTIHPFDDGNGRIARAIADMQLARAERSCFRYYSLSAQIRLDRKAYYTLLERTQRGSLDITDWLVWFLNCLRRALHQTEQQLAQVLTKAQVWSRFGDISLNDRQRLLINKLWDGFDGKLTSSKWAKIAKCSQDTASRDIQDLIQKGMLTKDEAGGRSTSYSLRDQTDL